MAPHEPGSPPRTPRKSAGPSGRGHHLSAVAHHFFSPTPETANPATAAPVVVVVGTGPDPVSERVAGLLAEAGPAGGVREVLRVQPHDLAVVETLREAPAGFLPPRTVVVWCPGPESSGSLLAVRDLGRWVRALRPVAVEILVPDPPDAGGRGAPGLLRARTERVAPGLPLRITRCGPKRLAAVIGDLGARLARGPETGYGP